jgi:hypothetical protein
MMQKLKRTPVSNPSAIRKNSNFPANASDEMFGGIQGESSD